MEVRKDIFGVQKLIMNVIYIAKAGIRLKVPRRAETGVLGENISLAVYQSYLFEHFLVKEYFSVETNEAG